MNRNKINHAHEIILYLLKKETHGRELAVELKTSLTKIQKTLNELRESNVVDFRVQGKNHTYFIKQNIISRLFILNAENYKLIKLLDKYHLLEPLFTEIINKYPDKMILLFGSYAKFSPKKESDIDIYIDTKDKRTKKDIERLYDKLSIKIGEFDKEDLLIKEIIKNHVIIQGGEKYYEKIQLLK